MPGGAIAYQLLTYVNAVEISLANGRSWRKAVGQENYRLAQDELFEMVANDPIERLFGFRSMRTARA